MKLLDRAIDRAVGLTATVQALALGIKAVADQLPAIAQCLAVVVRNQEAHQRAIEHLWVAHQKILQRLGASSLDVSLPELDKPKAADEGRAAVARKKPN